MASIRLRRRWLAAAASLGAWLAVFPAAAAPVDAGPGGAQPPEAAFSMSVQGLAEIQGRSPLLVLEGETGPPLSLWLAGYVISLLHETLTQALQAGAHDPPRVWERRVEYRVAHADARFVSLLFTDWSSAGGAHGTTIYHSFLWVRGPGGWPEAMLADLLLPEPGPRQSLSELLLARLRDAGAAWVTGGSIVQLSEERLRAFTLAPTGLTVHFAPCEVGPCEQGGFEVGIPVDALDGIVRPGILALLRDG